MAVDTVVNNSNNDNSLVGKKSRDDSDSLPSLHSKLNNENNPDKKEKRNKEYSICKYSKLLPLCEAVLINNAPYFLQVIDNQPKLSERVELNDFNLVPPQDRTNYLSKEYSFSSSDEIHLYLKRAKNETFSSLFVKVKSIWRKYFDIDDDAINICAADTIFSYFQDVMGMTHYLLFVGDNNTGKSNALRIFYHLGYRPLFDTSITHANIYNFLDKMEEGQGIILEDEIDNIEEQGEKMKIYKGGYVSGTKSQESMNRQTELNQKVSKVILHIVLRHSVPKSSLLFIKAGD